MAPGTAPGGLWEHPCPLPRCHRAPWHDADHRTDSWALLQIAPLIIHTYIKIKPPADITASSAKLWIDLIPNLCF